MKITGLLRSQASELRKWGVKSDIVPPDLSLVREGKEVIIPHDGRAGAGTVCTTLGGLLHCARVKRKA